jgi:hypothetical protein
MALKCARRRVPTLRASGRFFCLLVNERPMPVASFDVDDAEEPAAQAEPFTPI